MVPSSFLCTVLVALLETTASTQIKVQDNEDVDIVQFLRPDEKIWTTHTTARQSKSCQYDLVQNITEHNVTFERLYYERSSWKSRRLIGNFINFPSNLARMLRPYDSMDVKTEDGDHIDTEVVHYKSKTNSCAVFLVLRSYRDTLQLSYEVRMKDYAIKQRYSSKNECFKKFKADARKLKKSISPVYSAACQYI
uniref:Lipocalin n=1 Tax=Rhipicephalus zambeziensis TaxID=60191 RepID=A0A224YMC1_9ACAR